jgi:hypothetical protein
MKPQKIREIIENLGQRRPDIYRAGEIDSPIHTISKLNQLICKDDLVVVASRPSIGKTTLMLNLLVNHVMEKKEPVLFVAVKGDIDHISFKLSILLEACNAFDLIDYIFINSTRYPYPENYLELISNSFTNNQIQRVFVDDINSILEVYPLKDQCQEKSFRAAVKKYHSDINNLYMGLRLFTKENQIPIIISENIPRDDYGPNHSFRNYIHEIQNEKLEEISDLLLIINRLEYYDIQVDQNDLQIGNRLEINLAKCRYLKSGETHFLTFIPPIRMV